MNARLLTIGCVLAVIAGVGALTEAALYGEIFAKCTSWVKTKYSEEPYWFLFGMSAHIVMTMFAVAGIFIFGRQWKLQRLRERAMKGDPHVPKKGVNFGFMHFERD